MNKDRRQILLTEVDPRAVRVKPLPVLAILIS